MEKEYNLKRVNPPFWQHDFWVLKRLVKILLLLTKKHVSNKKVNFLDYGCGTYPYREMLSPFSKTYKAIDIGDNPQADILISENQAVPLQDESIDVVLSTQVLEHVENIRFYLSECRRLLKNEGILILSTHGVWPYHPYPKDFYRWTKYGLENEITKAGFKKLEIYSILGPFATITQNTLLLLAERLISKSIAGKILLAFFSLIGNSLIFIEDFLFSATDISDAALYIVCAKKI